MAEDKHSRWARALAGKTGRAYWRSLVELMGSPELQAEALQTLPESPEFPEGADTPPDVGRRDWLKLLGASMALAGIGGCSSDRVEGILPYVQDPPDVTPGNPRFYATSMELDGFATGLLVKSIAGRPIKVEGNPEHPASLGATGIFEQASVLGLYDPQRARGIRRGNTPASWEAFLDRLGGERPDRGAGLRVVLLPTSSPLLGDLIARVLQRHPLARFVFDAPLAGDGLGQGTELAFGRRLQPQYDFSRARVILSLDADFLDAMPFCLRYARQFADRRRPGSPAAEMNRLYVVESMLSPTGSMADHRFARRPSEIPGFAAAVVAELAALPGMGAPGELVGALTPLRAPEGEARALALAIARDLAQVRGTGLVVAGERQPPVVQALAHLANTLLQSRDAAWTTEPTWLDLGGAAQSLADMAADLRDKRADTVIVLEANPSYTAPPELELSRLLRSAPESVYVGLYENETAADCRWFVPGLHYLESWGDARAYDGTISMIQPLIRPLFGGRTASEILAVLAGDRHPDARRLLNDAWARRETGRDSATRFQAALRLGLVEGSALPRVDANRDAGRLAAALAALAAAPRPPEGTIEAIFTADSGVYDGRFANNPWLLELPRPMTKLTWDNAAMMGPAMARRLGVDHEDMVELELRGRRLRMPALVVPGHADGAVTLPLGYGRRGTEALALGVGFDTYQLRPADSPYVAAGLGVRKLDGERHELALTQTHWSVERRPIAPAISLQQYREKPEFTAELKGPVPSLLPLYNQKGEQWAMTIDLSICTGCSACVVACQAENNVLVVGKEDVRKSREMHWLRIDTYYAGDPDAPEVVHQPMLCQHCEKAPCEYVCPVNATVHSPDGLNEMVYNRCVGTRFCSNNCPYKVRRFNWFDYKERGPAKGETFKLQHNPDVTVRERGVMEKCTYCVQRIRSTEIQASIERRSIRPGEVMTACQQACPTRAIQFDSLQHTETKMVAWREEPRSYTVLHELGTRPRNWYLARINNPNPEIG